MYAISAVVYEGILFNHRTMSVDMGGGSPFPVTPSTRDKRRMSFRQAIFQRVVTPMSEKKKLITGKRERQQMTNSLGQGFPNWGA